MEKEDQLAEAGKRGAKVGVELKELFEARREAIEPLEITYEPPPVDIVTINGIRYTGEFFRLFAFPDPNLVYSFERFGKEGAVMIYRHGTKEELGLC